MIRGAPYRGGGIAGAGGGGIGGNASVMMQPQIRGPVRDVYVCFCRLYHAHQSVYPAATSDEHNSTANLATDGTEAADTTSFRGWQ